MVGGGIQILICPFQVELEGDCSFGSCKGGSCSWRSAEPADDDMVGICPIKFKYYDLCFTPLLYTAMMRWSMMSLDNGLVAEQLWMRSCPSLIDMI